MSAYEPKLVEEKWNKFWEEKQFFKADAHSKKPAYCIVMPPPNVTGNLHMGHALVSTLQDILIRWKRMSGYEALWVPGTDHAGIATQTVVERKLFADTGKRRVDFPREEFLEHVWAHKEKYGSAILEQVRSMGCSCDWSRLRFTLDEGSSRAVRVMFDKLYKAGLIYQGDYLVNWDTISETALADDEVDYEDQEGFLWYFRYPFVDGSGSIEIATTRPETMLGDTAVVVHPEDTRYKQQIGKMILHPITNRQIPLLGDPMVDPTFGTGAVKVTPGHDRNDYDISLRHNLPLINIMTTDGKVNQNGAPFTGLTFPDARVAVIQELEKLGLFVKKVKHTNRIGRSYRSKAVIEPMLSKQWFIKLTAFKDRLKEIVEKGETRLIPNHWGPTYNHWIDNLRDWCISRQLWWGHRIPVWHNKKDPSKKIVVVDQLPKEIATHPDEWEQDHDVLDTWFSSGLWPFSTLGWPEKTPDLEKFYPNSTLITGYDILFFWVARMIMMGDFAMDTPPFPETFLHGLIFGKSYWRVSPDGMVTYCSKEERDGFDAGKPLPKDVQSKWEKMSKSKGNIIDPMEMIQAFGADATRLALASCPTSQRQIDLDRRRLEEYKNFANKFWNGARFVLMNLGDEKIGGEINVDNLLIEDKWIMTRLRTVIQEVNDALATYSFDKAVLTVYKFFWDEFCAYYLEIAKPILKEVSHKNYAEKKKILFMVLEQSIRLLHPFTPFITEELFSLLKEKAEAPQEKGWLSSTLSALSAPAAAVASYPKADPLPFEEMDTLSIFNKLQEAVGVIRNIRAEMKIPPGESSSLILVGKDKDLSLFVSHLPLIKALVKLGDVQTASSLPSLPLYASAFHGDVQWIVPLPPQRLEAEKVRLTKELEKVRNDKLKLEGQLGNADFCQKAPAELVKKLQVQLSEALEKEKNFSQTLEKIG